jgi:hypothetical protein
MWSDVVHRLRALFFRRSVETELDRELQFHLEHQMEKYTKAGLTPEEAARRARLDLGGIDRAKEEYRDALGTTFLDILAQDLRYASRTILGNPAFTLVAVLSLALAIGANTAVFSLVNVLMLRDLPVARPNELVEVGRATQDGPGNLSYPLYESSPRPEHRLRWRYCGK